MRVIPRSEWGARHPNGFGTAPLPATEVWLHHSVTAAPNLVAPFDDDYRAIRTLEDIGQARFGGGISYTWPITPAGLIFEGHSVNRRGAHTRGHNTQGRAICLVGNYTSVDPTPAQLDAVVWLLRHAKAQGWVRTARLTGGHRDVSATGCPGDRAYPRIGEINRRAAAGGPITPGPVTPPPVTPPPVTPPPATGLPTLRYGERSPAVQHLQEFMTRVYPTYNSYRPTGFYGDQTAAGIREFQRRKGIKNADGSVADGRTVGPSTNAALAENGYR